MRVESVLVTGANRGIGLEFVRQFSKLEDPPKFIFATYRKAETLQNLKNIQDSSAKSKVILLKLDTTVAKDIEEAKKVIEETVGDRGLNLLINNAGVLQKEAFPKITTDNLEAQFKVNTVAPVMILQTLFPLLEKASETSNIKGKRACKAAVINLSSMRGSVQDTGVGYTGDLTVPGYKISKAALNMAMRVIAANVKDKDVLVVNICPGWVKTDMGTKEYGEIEVGECIDDLFKIFPKLNETHHGSFIDRFGKDHNF